ncbi:endonuclease [Solibacillus sp. FSL H8-0538]|uniref:endonuclease n=1 Tax=Solibacillus sp. FSL H8-0538 TaxID=2921400 RepID=UPI0030FB371B
MTRIAALINQLDVATELLHLQIQTEQARLTHRYQSQLVRAHQKVSLAEKCFQVKNRCSPIGSEKC